MTTREFAPLQYQWEYLVTKELTENELTRLGLEGWELIQITNWDDYGPPRGIFKRPKRL